VGREAQNYRLGDWIVKPQLNQICSDQEVRTLAPKAMDVLVCLLTRPTEVLSADDLINLAWHGRPVEESSVHQRISQIRKALGDDSLNPSYIESVPRRGYRTLADVESLTVVTQRGSQQVREVAIRSLRNLTPDSELDWLADGLTEHLRRQIDIWRGYNVIPASLQGTGGNGLPNDLDFLLDGFIQQDGRRVVVNLELVDVTQSQRVWTEQFEGEHEDPYELQQRISISVARFFGESLDLRRAPSVPQAYGPYLRMLAVASYGNYEIHLQWLERALELDPAWSTGWADMALLLLRASYAGRDNRYLERARVILKEQPRTDVSRGYFTLCDSWLNTYWDADLDKGERLAAQLAAGGLSWPYGMILLVSGLDFEAESYFSYMTETYPYHPVGWEMLAESRLQLGDMAGAVAAARQLVRLYPPGSLNSDGLLAWPLVMAGELDEAAELMAALEVRTERLPEGFQKQMSRRRNAQRTFEFAAMTGEKPKARSAIDQLIAADDYMLAGILCLRIDDARAERLLAEPIQPQFERYAWWKTTVSITPEIAEHPAIDRIYTALGFTPQWRCELARRAARLPAKSHISCDPQKYGA
jgi:DNA-binding winged helix-turn-helix (wHTH) protein/tetratricopeptide (TPR) repeat protein